MSGFGRRSLLRGLSLGAGGLFLAPLLRRSEALANGAAIPPRLIILMEGDCLRTSSIMPQETLAALTAVRKAQGHSTTLAKSSHFSNETPLVTTGLTLPRALEPLTAYLDQVNLVFGLSNTIAAGGPSHSADYGALSCTKAPRGVAGGETLDHYLGRRVGADSVFSRLALGSIEFPVGSDGTVRTMDIDYGSSASGLEHPSPIYVNPPHVYRMLFGSVLGSDARSQFDRRRSLVDALAADTKKAEATLRGTAKETFGGYMNALEMLKQRDSRIISMEAALQQGLPTATDTYTSPHPLARLEAQCDLASAALSVGLTRVALLASACSNRRFSIRYTDLDPAIPAKHHFGHGGDFLGQNNRYWTSEVHHRHALCIVRMIERLKAVPEGDGTAWDNTMVMYLADGGEQHHSTFREWPAVLITGKNIRVQTAAGGRSVIYPGFGRSNHRQLSNLYNTVCHAMGAPEDEFGGEGDQRMAKGPLPEVFV